MSEEEVVASEQLEEETKQEEQKMVPLAALEAERKKRQESEAKAQLYQEYVMRAREEKASAKEEDDPGALIEKGYYQADKQMTKREILEQVFQETKPDAVVQINKYLKSILEMRPWLADSVDMAQNRYARAFEIVNDYRHLIDPPVRHSNDAERIVVNSQKPRSPHEVGKSMQPSGREFLKSIQGKAEFREYRQKVRRGEI